MTEVTPPAFDGQRALHSPRISFEFFPPKTEEMERSLWETINRLAPLTPNFVSVTYGAGGSTRERTHSTIARILKETRLTPAAHLTCVGAPKGEIDDVVARYHEIGVRHIVALRGDPTTGIGTAYHAHPDGYQSSPELIAGVPFYGAAAPTADVPKIKAELMIVFAENDERINTMWPAYEAALKAAGVKYTAFNYAGTQHGFNNDTTPRYDEKSAGLAWGRTVALFNRALRA